MKFLSLIAFWVLCFSLANAGISRISKSASIETWCLTSYNYLREATTKGTFEYKRDAEGRAEYSYNSLGSEKIRQFVVKATGNALEVIKQPEFAMTGEVSITGTVKVDNGMRFNGVIIKANSDGGEPGDDGTVTLYYFIDDDNKPLLKVVSGLGDGMSSGNTYFTCENQ